MANTWDLKTFGSRIALIGDEGEMTYQELDRASVFMANHMSPRSLVFLLCTNTPGAVIGYTGCLNQKIVPLMIKGDTERDHLDRLFERYQPEYLWVPEVRMSDFPACKVLLQAFGHALLETGSKTGAELYPDLALLLTTSGSTGSAKMVRLSYENLAFNMEAIVDYLGITEEERAITTLPLSYTYGLSIINSHLHAGAAIILNEASVLQKKFWQRVDQYRATSFGGVPYTYELLDQIDFYHREIKSLTTMTQAGGRLSTRLHEKIARYALSKEMDFIVMYGQTEATARMAYLPREATLKKVGSVGVAIPGGRFYLMDEDKRLIEEAGRAGEMVYEGRNVALGYAESRDDLIKGDEFAGRLFTGDLAQRDDEGFYFIVGRKKRFLKMFGNRVNLDEVEDLIRDSFDDMDCAVAGRDDALVVFITDPDRVSPVEGLVLQGTGMPSFAVKMVVIEKIPKNASGKTAYVELKKLF
jgi:acyl-coenzyme A synthetase/AMP-(fatty) acid ligase